MTTTPSTRRSSDARSSAATSTVTALGVCAVVGFIVPNAMVVLYGVTSGFTTASYFRLWVASVPSTQLTLDLVLVSIAFFIWSRHDSRRTGTRWWPVVPGTLLVGICFAVPFYLWQRERASGGSEATRA